MTRRAGLIVLLLSVVMAVLLSRLPRTPPVKARALSESTSSHSGSAHAGGSNFRPLPLKARPAKSVRGRFRGGQPPVPRWFDATVLLVPRALVLDTNIQPEQVPPLNTPTSFAAKLRYPNGDEMVVGVVIDGVPRAYPLNVLNSHWAVNDVVDGRRVAILWDPVAGAATAYQGALDGRPVEMGASGKWYRGNALFYDRSSTSLLPAITGRFVSGPLAGQALRPIPFRRESWKSWVTRYPNTTVVYRQENSEPGPFSSLGADPKAIADILPSDDNERLPSMEWVIGFLDPIGEPTCCALKDLPGDGPLRLGRAVIERQPEGGARVMLSGGVWPQQTVCRYFAWRGLYPDTRVWPPSTPEHGRTESN